MQMTHYCHVLLHWDFSTILRIYFENGTTSTCTLRSEHFIWTKTCKVELLKHFNLIKQYINKVLDMLKIVFGPLTLYILRLTTLQALQLWPSSFQNEWIIDWLTSVLCKKRGCLLFFNINTRNDPRTCSTISAIVSYVHL